MEILNNINWQTLAREVQSSLNDRFRKVWVNYTRLGSVQFTLFPIINHETYRIVTRSKFIDCNKNVFAYAKSFMPDVSFETPPTEQDRLRASEILTAALVKIFVNAINEDLPPAP